MPQRIEGKDEFNPIVKSPLRGERDYDNTVECSFQSFADRTIWLKNRVTELQDSIGSDSGSTVLVGEGPPYAQLGEVGDLYIDSQNGIFYTKTSSGWVVAVNISDFSTTIFSAPGGPAASLGKDGDLYIDTDTSNFYHKNGENWILVLDTNALGGTGLLDTINNVDAINKNIDLIPGDGIEVVPNDTEASITIQLYTSPTASLSNNVGTVEIGTTVTSVGLSWNYNKDEESQSLNNGIGSLPVGDRSYTHESLSLTDDVTYTITMSDGTNNASANTFVKFRHRVHWGTSANTSLSSAEILTLDNQSFSGSRNSSFTIDGNGEYLYYCYPEDFGEATFTVNGLLNTAWTLEIVSHTNASGHTENYRVYRSNYIQNGTDIEVEVS